MNLQDCTLSPDKNQHSMISLIRFIMRKPLFSPLVLLFAFAIPKLMDNDTYWLLALGKSIAENGIPYSDVLTMHEGLEVIQQQWLTSLVYYGVYSALGYAGLLLFQLCVNICIYICIMALALEFGGDSNRAFFIGNFSACILIIYYGLLRPQTITVVLSAIELIALDRYRKTREYKHLFVLPLISVAAINMHASMWPMIFVYMLPFFAEALLLSCAVIRERIHIKEPEPEHTLFNGIYPHIIAVITFGAGFLNPYGFRAMTYLFTSFNIPIINNNITEMAPLSLRSYTFLFLVIAVSALSVVRSRMPIRYYCLFIGTAFLGLSSVKGCMEFLIAGLATLTYKFTDGEKRTPGTLPKFCRFIPSKHIRAVSGIILSCIVIISSFAIQLYRGLTEPVETKAADNIALAVEYAEANTDISADSRIYSEYNHGGYLEFCGYKPYIDARAEVFLKENNGKKDILQEYFDSRTPQGTAEEFLSEYDFDFIFVYDDTGIGYYLSHSDSKYTLVFSTDESDEDKNKSNVQLWVKTR